MVSRTSAAVLGASGAILFRKETEHPLQHAPCSHSTVGPVVAAIALSRLANPSEPNASAADESLQNAKKSRRDMFTRLPFLLEPSESLVRLRHSPPLRRSFAVRNYHPRLVIPGNRDSGYSSLETIFSEIIFLSTPCYSSQWLANLTIISTLTHSYNWNYIK